MSTKNLRLKSCICGVLATAALGGTAIAQEKSTTLEEIVVTAERRSESLQDVPLSITAFGDEKRDIVGILTIQDMANFAPGVSFNMATDRPSIRGIGRQSNFFTIDSPVANYFDGIYTSSVQDAQRRPIFIERTEILRGPQGALSGRGSIAGAFNTISKPPLDAFGAEVRAFGGNFSNYGGEATVSGPLADWARARVNIGSYHQNRGYFHNLASDTHEGDQPNNRNIEDFLFDFNFGDHVKLYLKAAFANYDESGHTVYSTSPRTAGYNDTPSAYGPSTGTLNPLVGWAYFSPGSVIQSSFRENPVLVTGNDRDFVSDIRNRQELDDHHSYTAHLTWNAPWFDVNWIGGHQNYRYTATTDNDFTDVLAMRLPATAFFPTGRLVEPGSLNRYFEERKWFSNELTLTSTSEGAFSWIFGLYQSDEKFNQEPATTIFPGYAELNDPIRFAPGIVFQARNPVPFTSVRGLINGETISSAAFGQLGFKIADQLTITGGLRYNKDGKDADEALRYIANGLGNATGPILAGGGLGRPYALDVTPTPTAATGGPGFGPGLPEGVIADYGIDPVDGYRKRVFKNDWTAVTGSVGVDYKPRTEDLIYLRMSKGYRPGGFNAGFLYDPAVVDKETVISYEVGYKTTLFSQLQLNSSVFYYDYRDIQLPLPTLGRCTDPNDLSTCTSLNSFVNLPKGRSMGLELEANWAPTDSINIFLSYGYLNAKIVDALSGSSSAGYSNPDDPAAVLASADRYKAIPGQFDTGYTNMQRYTQDLSGNQLANSPHHKAALSTAYTMSFSPGKLILSGDVVYRAKMYSDVFETEQFVVPSFTTFGARLLWVDAEDRYTVIVYGTNLSDKEAADGATLTRLRLSSSPAQNAAGGVYYRNLGLSPPREFGVEVQYRVGKTRK